MRISRFLRQAHRSALPWERIHDELWLKSNQVHVPHPRAFQPISQGRVSGKVETTPKGYCFRFHKGRKCVPGCAYKHQCFKCEGSFSWSTQAFQFSAPSCQVQLFPPYQRHDRLSFLLKGYTHSTVEFLISGFTHGFPIHFQGERQSRKAKNLLSALDNPAAVVSKLRKELEAQRLAGPFKSPPLSIFWISPLGVVPKKVPGEFRLIHHLSFPRFRHQLMMAYLLSTLVFSMLRLMAP